jgi:hypothetical protein
MPRAKAAPKPELPPDYDTPKPAQLNLSQRTLAELDHLCRSRSNRTHERADRLRSAIVRELIRDEFTGVRLEEEVAATEAEIDMDAAAGTR